MQPTIILSAPESGLIYLNGRFAGEISAAEPIIRPVCPQGTLYIEFRPLTDACCAMARRIEFSGGRPSAESMDEAEELSAVAWPNGAVELELLPKRNVRTEYIPFEAGKRQFVLESGAELRLMRAGHVLAELPQGAEIPQLRSMEAGDALTGSCSGGMYLVCLNREGSAATGFLTAKHIEIESDRRIRAVTVREDPVGHASIETWLLEEEGLRLEERQSAWANGAPRWPQTPAETARAAVEAALAGLTAEAEGYLTPSLRDKQLPQRIRERCDLCAEMRYGIPNGKSCIALLRLAGGSLAVAEPLYYRVSASGGIQGPFRLEALEFDNPES